MFPPHTRILIVDDMPTLRDLLKAYLRRLGFRGITEADDGRMAYQALLTARASGSPFELVISDWNMPNMDGIELLKLVRSSPEWKNLPFLILTTESEKAKVIEAVTAQVSNYMVKPVDEEMLKDKLKKVYDKLQASKT
jgi:two-component system chemotaxis response regulator CheY